MTIEYSNTPASIQWLTAPNSHDETITLLKQTPELFNQYQQLSSPWKEQFLSFMEGNGFLPLTYDPFFKSIFHPDIHKERLESLISSLLNINVSVKAILPNEDSMMIGEGYLIMDLLVELEDGSLCNVEIQRQPYGFPAQRISCYSADLLMRQYARVKGEKGKNFIYQDIKKVYVIVIYQKSAKAFHNCKDQYIHYGKTKFDTNLDLDFLQEYVLIALDVFQKTTYAKEKSVLTAWLSLLSTDSLRDAERLIKDYPWIEEIYREISLYRHKPKEVLNMWSESLRILDENSLKYYVEQLQQQIDDKDEALSQKDNMIAQQATVLSQKDETIAQQTAKIEELEKQLKMIEP